MRCSDCRTLFAQLSNADFDYSTYNHCESDAFIAGRLKEIVTGFASHRLTNKLLDVGCGTGAFLEAATSLGWEATGVEISATAIQIAASKGLSVVDDCDMLPSDSFDVIIMSEVLEHVLEPMDLLTAARRLLRRGGLLWATTPHGNGVSMRLLRSRWSIVSPPEHVQLFSIEGASRLLQRANLSPVRIKAESVNPYELMAAFRRAPVDRVASSRELNATVSASTEGRMLKKIVNGILASTRLGDSLKIQAIKAD